jgi:hypothetical protein
LAEVGNRVLVFLSQIARESVFDRAQQFVEPHARQHLRAHAVDHGERDLGAVLRRIDVDPEWPLAERRVRDRDDCFGDFA